MEELNRTIGITFNNHQCAIKIWSPLANEVSIKVEGRNELILLKPEGYGYWKGNTPYINPGTLYKVIINGEQGLPDPASLSQPLGVHGWSKAIDLKNFAWSDNGWKNFSLDQYIIYELHTGTFSPEGTFQGIEAKLDHLVALGITAIEIMPVAQFPGTRNWGYDGVYPFAVQDSYGGAEGFQRLVNACHQRGIAVVLDVVYNHLGPEGNYLGSFGPYFTNKYATPWGNALNFDDAWCDGVRDYFIENALMWFRDFHVDALRLDAVHAIKDFSPVHILKEIKLHTDALMKETGRVHHLIVELDLNDNRYINPIESGGYGMDAQWIDEFHHALRVTAGGERSGYYSDFTGIQHLAKSYRDAYVYDGQYSPHRNKKFGVKADKNSGHQFIVFSQNHDQVGNRMLGERTSVLVSFEMQKLLAGAVLVSPYIPMLFMGEEWSEPNPFQYFVSHTDPQLAEAVRKGRKEEFAAFHAEGEAPDPMAEETFHQSKLQWPILSRGKHKVMLEYYKALIHLRKNEPALYVLDRKGVLVDVNEKSNTLILQRKEKSQQIVCLMNFSKEEQSVAMPHTINKATLLFNSAHPKWGGSVAAPEMLSQNEELIMQPESIYIYEYRNRG